MKLNFTPINLERQSDYLDRFALCAQKTSDYSFVNLWGWAEEYGLHWAWTNNHVWIKQTKPKTLFWAPIGPWESIDWSECFEKNITSETTFTRIPEGLLKYWDIGLKNRLRVEESRGHWDYLYSVTELVELRGNRFHKKKNLLNQFKKKYAFKYVPLEAEMIHMALAMQEDWCTWRDCESSELLSAENRAISRVLKSSEEFAGVTGGAIIIDQKMVSYTVAENLTTDTLLIHFEKGSPEYKGIYQAINQMFLEHSGVNFTTVNREQDLDNEGLRKAKISYHPIDFIKKYKVILV